MHARKDIASEARAIDAGRERASELSRLYYEPIVALSGTVGRLIREYLRSRYFHLLLIFENEKELEERLATIAGAAADESFFYFCRLVRALSAFEEEGNGAYQLSDTAVCGKLRRLSNVFIGNLPQGRWSDAIDTYKIVSVLSKPNFAKMSINDFRSMLQNPPSEDQPESVEETQRQVSKSGGQQPPMRQGGGQLKKSPAPKETDLAPEYKAYSAWLLEASPQVVTVAGSLVEYSRLLGEQVAIMNEVSAGERRTAGGASRHGAVPGWSAGAQAVAWEAAGIETDLPRPVGRVTSNAHVVARRRAMTSDARRGGSSDGSDDPTPADPIVDRLDETTTQSPGGGGVDAGPSDRCAEALLKECQLQGRVRRVVGDGLAYLDHQLVERDLFVDAMHMRIAMHQIGLDDGNCALLQLHPSLLESGDHWLKVQTLVGALHGLKYKRLFLFTEAPESAIHTKKFIDVWDMAKEIYGKEFAILGREALTKLDKHPERETRARMLRRTLAIPLGNQKNVESSGFRYPEVVRELIVTTLLQMGQHPLDRFFKTHFNRETSELHGERDPRLRTKAIVYAFDRQNHLPELFRAAKVALPGDDQLALVAPYFEQSPNSRGGKEYEEFLKSAQEPALERRAAMDRWVKQSLMEIRVCQVCLCQKCIGTGFLVGPDLVLTNYHVVEPMFKGEARRPASDLMVRFDYLMKEDGSAFESSTFVEVAAEWEVHFSPYHPKEAEGLRVDIKPNSPALDYCVIRLGRPIGNEKTLHRDGRKRGWIPVDPGVTIEDGDFVQILQHAAGMDLQLTKKDHSVTWAGPARVQYTTPTHRGSSGSPCFTADWELFALHHMGDASFPAFCHSDGINQGIPIAKIVDLLKEQKNARIEDGAIVIPESS